MVEEGRGRSFTVSQRNGTKERKWWGSIEYSYLYQTDS